MHKFSIIFILLLYFLPKSQSFAVSEIPKDLLHHADAVVRAENTTITINSIDDMEKKYDGATTILNKRGEAVAHQIFRYNKNSRVSDIKVSILDKDGKIIRNFSRKDMLDISNSPSYALYVDDRMYYLPPQSIDFPYTITYSYVMKTSNTIFIDRFIPSTHYGVSTENTSFSLLNNSGIPIRTKISKGNLIDFSDQKTDKNVYHFNIKNIPAYQNEDLSPTLESLLPTVEFALEKFTLERKQGDFKDWNSFGKWYHEKLLLPVSEKTPEIKKEVMALQLEGLSHDEKVKKIFQHMQKKTRYVLVSIGIGGWQPMPAHEVSIKSYGDCKALTNYTRTLLEEAGIKSKYAVIYSDHSPKIFDADFPMMGGNHVILAVPNEKGQYIWLENTSQSIPYNHLNFSTRDRNVFAIDENGIELIKTPIYDAGESKEIIKSKVILNNDGTADIKSTLTYTGGQYDFVSNYIDLKTDELKDKLKDKYVLLRPENIEVSNLNYSKDIAEIKFDLQINATNYSKYLGENMYFRAVPIVDYFDVNKSEARILPLYIPFSYQDEYYFEYEIPKNFILKTASKPISIVSEFGSYSLEISNKEDKLFVKRLLMIKKGTHPKEKYNDYLEFRKKILNHDFTKILLHKNN